MMSEDFLAAVSPESRPKFYFEKERPSFHTAWTHSCRRLHAASTEATEAQAAARGQVVWSFRFSTTESEGRIRGDLRITYGDDSRWNAGVWDGSPRSEGH